MGPNTMSYNRYRQPLMYYPTYYPKTSPLQREPYVYSSDALLYSNPAFSSSHSTPTLKKSRSPQIWVSKPATTASISPPYEKLASLFDVSATPVIVRPSQQKIQSSPSNQKYMLLEKAVSPGDAVVQRTVVKKIESASSSRVESEPLMWNNLCFMSAFSFHQPSINF
jgi:hypothetical protein